MAGAMILSSYLYHIPYTAPFRTSQHLFKYREGIILHLQDGHLSYYGEIAPLPNYSSETLNDCIEWLSQLRPKIKLFFNRDKSKSLQNYLDEPNIPMACAFGIDTLYYDYELKDKLTKNISTESLKFNATIGIKTIDETIEECKIWWKKGYRTFKIKVSNVPHDVIAIIHEVRHQFSTASLRIDANQSWTYDQAIHILKNINNCDIEYCEEPIKKPTPNLLYDIYKATSVPLALDESVRNVIQWQPYATMDIPFIVILKPTMSGSFENIKMLVRAVQKSKKDIIFSSTFETMIGRCAISYLACCYGSLDYAHGIATGYMLAEEPLICTKKSINKGIIPNGVLNMSCIKNKLWEIVL